MSFEQPNELKTHIGLLHPTEQRRLLLQYQPCDYSPSVINRFECYICKTQVDRLAELKKHIRQHAYNRTKCEICHKLLISSETQQWHLCDAIKSGIECEYCSKSFQAIRQLMSHLDNEHDNVIMYRCRKCPKYFGTKLLKKLHEKYHPVEAQKRFACDQCPKRYPDKKTLHAHLICMHSVESMHTKSNSIIINNIYTK